MKLSDYVAEFLARQGIRHVFAVSGGASLHLIQSIADTPGITFLCPQHEQAGAMAADAYARVTGNLGAAIATSGPGATNLVTGACCAYYDSIPVIFITGQVATFRMKGDTGVRQMGFQETDTVEIFNPITKYTVRVDEPGRIRYELEKACHLARSGRPGPVLVDLPDNLQRTQIEPRELEPFVPEAQGIEGFAGMGLQIERCLELIATARRPVLILGAGIRLAKAEKEVSEFMSLTGFPVAPTWAVADFLPGNHPQLIGTFGTHGTRYANFAVQNADLIVSVGSRLDTKATGSPMTTFARGAPKVVVDIDGNELAKFERFGLEIDVPIQADARHFLSAANMGLDVFPKRDLSPWIEQIARWKQKFPICPAAYYDEEEVNPYVLVKELSRACQEGETLLVDTGCALAWMMQAFDFKPGQRLYHDFNNTAMGWALPASIGACFAVGRSPVICVTGDGSLQMNIQELATVIRHQLPVKIFLINNRGYGMIQQTQDQWLDSNYLASTVEGGLAFPDWEKVAAAYGFRTFTIARNRDVGAWVREALAAEGPVFCNVEIRSDHRVVPQVRFGRPNEDSDPLMDREEFRENMIVEPLEVPLK